MHPEHVWEFEEKQFKQVLYRNGASDNMSDNGSDVSDTHESPKAYRGGDTVSSEMYTDLLQKFQNLSERMDTQRDHVKQFSTAMVDAIANVSNDVVDVNPNAKFCQDFSRTHRSLSPDTQRPA